MRRAPADKSLGAFPTVTLENFKQSKKEIIKNINYIQEKKCPLYIADQATGLPCGKRTTAATEKLQLQIFTLSIQ